MERRSTLRLYQHFPVTVAGVDVSGKRFKLDTVLDNISSGGLYLYMHSRLPPAQGTKLFFVVRFSLDPNDVMPALRVAMRGVVRRVELKPSGACGVAVAFTRQRPLKPASPSKGH